MKRKPKVDLNRAVEKLVEKRLITLLGLNRWFVGVNKFRTDSGHTPVWVDYLWTLFGWPSFDPWWYLAGVRATPEVKRRPLVRVAWMPETDFMPGKDGTTELGVAADLTPDSFIDAANSLQLFGRCPGGSTLDGISYEFRFRTCCVQGGLSFGNPQRADLIELERSAYALGRRIEEATGSPALKECLEVWEKYRSRLGASG